MPARVSMRAGGPSADAFTHSPPARQRSARVSATERPPSQQS
jgi:hypothetical protein